MAGPARYAIYFAPASGSPLARFGAKWVGYDVTTGAAVAQPELAAIDAKRLHEITAEPRRYGFHATLKPPFRLADGLKADALDEAAAAFARGFSTFIAPPLCLSSISGFWALTPSEPCPMLDRLAEDCVRAFDRFRAPPSEAELARRRASRLSSAQETLLAQWGYPYVMEEFRFHMTLTGRLGPEEGTAVAKALKPLVEPLCGAPLPIDAICLFRQADRDAPFRLLRRYELAG